jgi:O-antigen/teichoic acid export membrane protein
MSADNETGAPVTFNRGLELLLYSVGLITTLVTAPILAHGLGPAGRGQYGVAIAVATLMATLGSWGQAEVFLKQSRSSTAHYRLHSRISWVGSIAASVVCVFVLLAVDLPLSTALVTAVWIPVLTQAGLWRSASIARGQLKLPALDSAFGSLLKVASLAALAALTLLTTDSALFAYLGTLALGSLVTIGRASWRSGLGRQVRATGLRPLLISGTGIITFNLLHAVTLRADVIVLQLVAAPTEVGLYAAPASLTTAALALSVAFRPRVQAAALSAAPLREIVRNCLLCFALAAVGTVALWLATPVVVPILFGSQFAGAEPLMRMLAFAIGPLLMVDLIFAALIVLGRQRDLLLVAAGSAFLNLLTLGVMCPLWGAYGAALANVVSYSLATVFGAVILVRATRLVECPDEPSDAPPS